MTACNGCGRCCSPVALAFTQDDIRHALPMQIDSRDRRWILDDLTPISRREGLRLVSDHMDGGITTGLLLGEVTFQVTHFYTCRHYDADANRCGIYDERPPMCAGFPWYAMAPDDRKALPPECSYNADVGRPVRVGMRGSDHA